MTRLDAATAANFARLTLGHVGLAYPYKLDHVLTGPEQLMRPDEAHPIFHGSFDWHSCVHGWWQLLAIARLFPDLPEAAAIRARAAAMLTAEKVAGELAFFERAGNASFERPYGWAWLLALHGEAARHDATWAEALAPLARLIATRFASYLPKLTYPIRAGTHGNTAFACLLTLGWARDHDAALAALIVERARDWYGEDRGCQAWEPGGDEFLSSALTEAALMRAVLPPADFAGWFGAFLPELAARRPSTLFTPATVSDRSDGKIAHLDGLNLSRAWCWRLLASPGDMLLHESAERHLAASLPHLADDYMGTHWLASFALLALLA